MYDEKTELIADFKARFPSIVPDDVELTCIQHIIYVLRPDVLDLYVRETLALLKEAWAGPEFNIFHTYDGTTVRFYVYLVSQEKVIMAALPRHLTKLLRQPSSAMEERCEESLHLFQDAIKEMAQDGSELQCQARGTPFGMRRRQSWRRPACQELPVWRPSIQ